jgi:hypothetical protein
LVTRADWPVLRKFCELELLCSQLFADLIQRGLYQANGHDTRRALTEYRRLSETQLRYADKLMLTPAIRAMMQRGDASLPMDIAALATRLNGEAEEPQE